MNNFKVTSNDNHLIKVDPELARHLAALRSTSPESAKFLANRLFGDSMVKGVGNKLAYEDFLSRPRQGVHVMIDGNDFGAINKKWGQSVGDDAIKAMGSALSRVSRTNKMKLFRIGGDEFAAYADTPEQAYSFARHARQELESLPPVKGQHYHSVSIGFGHRPEHAEQALIHAKKAKQNAGYLLGHAQTHAYSLLPGAAGEVPISKPEEVPINKPEETPSPIKFPVKPGVMGLGKSEGIFTVVHNNPSNPVPVFFLANNEGLSPDGASFIKFDQLIKWCGDLAKYRQYGFIPRMLLAKNIQISFDGRCTFERH